MTDQAPATASEARALLDAKVQNREWGAAILNGDATAIRELHDLTGKVDSGGDDVVAAAISGKDTGGNSRDWRVTLSMVLGNATA